jgi:hypothetical protein
VEGVEVLGHEDSDDFLFQEEIVLSVSGSGKQACP